VLASLRAARTVLISTHLLSELTASVDRVLIVHRGRVAFDGTPQALAGDGSIESAFHALTSNDPSAAADRERRLDE
jgi:ABC-2 type transport system ATP-binding protein